MYLNKNHMHDNIFAIILKYIWNYPKCMLMEWINIVHSVEYNTGNTYSDLCCEETMLINCLVENRP